MTQVTTAKSPLNDTKLKVGQCWVANNGLILEILKLELLPFMNAKNNNTQVTYRVAGSSGLMTSSFLEFVTSVTELECEPKTNEAGLHEHHLLDSKLTIAAGQRYRHYKGDVYAITDVSLDANVGSDDFNKARISYRSIENGKEITWNLSVEEFLTYVGDIPRFTLLPRVGSAKRDVRLDCSLKFLWRKSA